MNKWLRNTIAVLAGIIAVSGAAQAQVVSQGSPAATTDQAAWPFKMVYGGLAIDPRSQGQPSIGGGLIAGDGVGIILNPNLLSLSQCVASYSPETLVGDVHLFETVGGGLTQIVVGFNVTDNEPGASILEPEKIYVFPCGGASEFGLYITGYVSGSGTGYLGGGPGTGTVFPNVLTDAQLRATAVEVSGLDREATGVLDALDDELVIEMTGAQVAAAVIQTSNFAGSLSSQVSYDGGSSYVSAYHYTVIPGNSFGLSGTDTYTGGPDRRTMLLGQPMIGVTHVKVKVGGYTSGTATIRMTASSAPYDFVGTNAMGGTLGTGQWTGGYVIGGGQFGTSGNNTLPFYVSNNGSITNTNNLLGVGIGATGSLVAFNVRDGAGNPVDGAVVAPAGTERGLIVRNIPSGTQTVSGTVTVTDGAGAVNVIVDSSALPAGAATEATVNSLLKPASTLAAVTAITNPVTVTDGAGALNVIVDSSALPSGAATAALQTQPGVDIGDVTINNAAGAAAVNVQDGGNSLTIDGTVTVTDGAGALNVIVDSSALPSGAATAALQTQPGVDIGDVTINNAAGAAAVNVQDGGNSLTVDGTVTANAGTNLNTSALALAATQTDRTQKAQITDGTRDGTVKAATTAAAAADTSLVVALSPNSAIPTGANVIGALTANQSVNVTQVATAAVSTAASGVQKVGVVGNAGAAFDAANNAAAPANVEVIGLETITTGTSPTAATTGNVRRQLSTTEGVAFTREGSSFPFSCFVQAVTATTQCQAAPAAGLKAYVTSFSASNQAATVQTLDIVYGTGAACVTGTTAISHKWQFGTAAVTTSPFEVSATFATPLVPAAASAICVRPSAATAFGVTITGFIAP